MSDEPMTDKPDGWLWRRGIVVAIGLSVACQAVATYWIVSSLSGNTARIQKPYNDVWYALAVNAPAAVFWAWCFARPRGA
jgi:hypothetical protein